MFLNPIYITANTEAIDAAPTTKDTALTAVADGMHTPLDQVGAIGDSANDLPFLRLRHLGLVGAPQNAQPAIKKFIQGAPNGYLSQRDYLEGFFDFYDRCADCRLELVFADRDGVLLWNQSTEEMNLLAKLFKIMGNNGYPLVFILTGSSISQNLELLRFPAIAMALSHNETVRDHPRLVLAENGAIMLNVLDGSVKFLPNAVALEMCQMLTGEFRSKLLEKVRRDILPGFGLSFSANHDDQDDKIFIPEKKTMVTLNIPRKVNESDNYRRSLEADKLRAAIVEAMIGTAEHMRIPYLVLGEEEIDCVG